METLQQFMAAGVDVLAYMDDVRVALLELTPDAVVVIPHLREQLRDMEITINVAKTFAFPRRAMPYQAVRFSARWC